MPWGYPFRLLEIVSVVLGLALIGLSVVCVIATVTVIVTWGDPAPGFPGTDLGIQGLQGFGVVFFPLAALVTFAVGRWLAVDHLRNLLRAYRRRND